MHRTRLITLVVMLLCPVAAAAQDKADRVRYADRGRGVETTRTGTITAEDPVKLTIIAGTTRTKQDIPAADVVDVQYDGEPGEVEAARKAERGRNFDQARGAYEAALKRIPVAQKFLHAHVQFKAAEMLGQLADNGDEPSRKAALAALRQFRTDHPDARQALPALDLYGRLLLQEGQSVQDAVDGLGQLKARFNKEKDLSARCDLLASLLLMQEAEVLLKDRPDDARQRYAKAQNLLEAVLPGADSAAALDLRLSLAECKAAQGRLDEALKDLDAILRSAGDQTRTRSAVHLSRGDCLRVAGRPKDALWDYLWVDTVYFQDREQHAQALYCLAEVFTALGDASRARECRDRLVTDGRLRDTRYYKLAGR
jgi:tetratricopeptide (TPR) repeat protein